MSEPELLDGEYYWLKVPATIVPFKIGQFVSKDTSKLWYVEGTYYHTPGFAMEPIKHIPKPNEQNVETPAESAARRMAEANLAQARTKEKLRRAKEDLLKAVAEEDMIS